MFTIWHLPQDSYRGYSIINWQLPIAKMQKVVNKKMIKGITIDKSVIRESGPGDLILKIDGYPYEEKERRTYRDGLSLLVMDISKLRDCNDGYDKLQLPNSDILCVCIMRKESEEKYHETD